MTCSKCKKESKKAVDGLCVECFNMRVIREKKQKKEDENSLDRVLQPMKSGELERVVNLYFK